MKRVVDINAFLAQWNKDIEFHKQKVRELEQKISVAQEMASTAMTMATSEMTETEGGGESLAKEIVKLLERKREWLGTGEIADELVKEGFDKKSKSQNFRLYVITTVPKLYKNKRRKVDRMDEGGKIKYGALGLNKETIKPMFKS